LSNTERNFIESWSLSSPKHPKSSKLELELTELDSHNLYSGNKIKLMSKTILFHPKLTIPNNSKANPNVKYIKNKKSITINNNYIVIITYIPSPS
jgi:hypothetical protein